MLKRPWDERIGKIIVFSTIVFIAIWLVLTWTYFFNKKKLESTVMSVLNNPSSTPEELYKVWLCATPAEWSQVEVDVIEWAIYLICPSWFWPNA